MSQLAVIQSLEPQTLTWEQALSMLRLRGRAEGHSEHTAEHYRWSLGQAIEFFRASGADRPAAVTSVHVKRFLDALRERGLSSSTIQTRYRNMRTLFRVLRADGLMEQDPTDRSRA